MRHVCFFKKRTLAKQCSDRERVQNRWVFSLNGSDSKSLGSDLYKWIARVNTCLIFMTRQLGGDSTF